MAQEQDSLKLKSILEKTKKEAEERDAERRAAKAGVFYLNLAVQPVETDALELIPEEKAKEAQVAAIEKKGDRVVFAAFDSTAPKAKALIQELEKKGLKLKIFIVSLTSLQRAWDFYKYVAKKTGPITGRIDVDKERMEGLIRKLTALATVKKEINNFDFKKFPTAQILEIILAGALAGRASRIPFLPPPRAGTIRYSIDGRLRGTAYHPQNTLF